MAKGVIILIIIFILLIGGALGLYFFYEKPVQEKPLELINISIIAKNDEVVKTGYGVVLGTYDMNYIQGETLTGGFVLRKININESFSVHNENIGDQNYYTTHIEFIAIPRSVNVRVTLSLVEPGELEISQEGLFQDKSINLTLYSEKEFRNLHFCLRWTPAVVGVSTNINFTEREVPGRWANKVDKCYETEKSLQNSSIPIQINYEFFGEVTEEDFLEVVIMDGDERWLGFPYIDEKDGEDIGAPDVIYRIE